MPTATGTDPFIGREREMAELTTALDGALEGRGGLVMLAGEPGIGKTRLSEEIAAIAKDRGALVAWGACYEGGTAPPYWPWTQIIRSLLTEPSEAVMSALQTRGGVIADIVPEIRDMMPDMQPPSEVDPAQARFRLFDSVTSFLNEIAISQPVILVIDDLHWADRSTLDLLEFVAREVATRPMLLIGGYRDVELSRRHPLSETLATLARVRAFQRILLRGLASDEVSRLVEAVGKMALPHELIEEIHVRTEGNPFFVAEVTRDLAREAADRGGEFDALKFRIPEGVREAVGIHLNRLSEDCNHVLRIAAVIGREFDFELLTAVSTGLSEDELLDAVEEAMATGAIREIPGVGVRYEFTHALIQQTLADELSAGRRVRLHIRIIEAIEHLYPTRLDEHVAELAHHCSEAETVVGEEKALRYIRMAGERAGAAYAWVEARGYFEQALEFMGENAAVAERAEVLFGLGKAELQTLTYPEIQRGWENVARAFDLYIELGDTDSALALAMRSWGFPTFWVHGTTPLYARALELVAPDSADAGHLRLLYGFMTRLEEQNSSEGVRAMEQALEIAERFGDGILEGRALEALMRVRTGEGDFQGAIEFGQRAVGLAIENDQPNVLRGAYWGLASVHIVLGQSDEARRHIELLSDVKSQIGLGQSLVWLQFLIAYVRGEFLERAELAETFESGSPDDGSYQMLAGIRLWHIGENSGIGVRLKGAYRTARTSPSMHQSVANMFWIALAARLMDRPDDAAGAGEIAHSLLSLPKLNIENEVQARIVAGLAAVAIDDVQQARQQYAKLGNLTGILCAWGGMSGDRLLGLLAHTADMPKEAAAHFESALEFTGKAGYRLEAAWTCYDFAESLLDSGELAGIERAVTLIDEGLKITGELGLVGIDKRLITLQEKAKVISAPTPAYPDGLTEREVEVLGLLAAGSTNQQIADDLVIAPSTAAKHVANILGKTGSANRTEAAAYATQQSPTAKPKEAD